MFQVGEAVVHPGHGPGKVVGIERLSLSDSGKRYYKIRLLEAAETILWVPVRDAEEKGVRRPIPRSRLDEIWRVLRARPGILPTDHQRRYACLREKIEHGDVVQTAEALRDLHWKDHHVRSMTIEGKRLYDKGTKLLAAEIAVVQGSDTSDVEIQLSRAMTENTASREATQ